MKKKWVKLAAFALVLVTALTFTMCRTGPRHVQLSFTPGVFIGVADGMFGPIKAEVVFTGTGIFNARVIEHFETLSIVSGAIERVPRQIVKYQSLAVEIVSGATLTSLAIINAVQDAVIQAGGDPAILWANRAVTTPSTEVVNMEVEFVVVGGGGAGINASLGAAQRNQGDVVLLERMSSVGGATLFAALTDTRPQFAAFMRTIRRDDVLPNLELKLDTRATDLIMDGQRVVGVVAEHYSGRKYNIRAKYVILATGSFAANHDMLKYYGAFNKWPEFENRLLTTNPPGSMGDGVTMALQAGARLARMDDIVVINNGDPISGILETGVGSLSLGVNQQGNRFTDESWWTPGRPLAAERNRISRDVFDKADGLMWVISDHTNSGLNWETGLNGFRQPIDVVLNLPGRIFIAETIEELARRIGVPPTALRNSIDAWNALVDAGGVGCPFGRSPMNLRPATRIDTPPFYASARRPSIHATIGGLVRDPDTFQVIRHSDGQPIEGLYAIGELVDGFFGINPAFADGREIIGRIFP